MLAMPAPQPPTPNLSATSERATTIPVGELRVFQADVLTKRSETWSDGKAVLLDRQPHRQITQFAHCVDRHTIAMHIEGANTSTMLRYNDGARNATGSTIGQIMFIPAGQRLEGCADYPAMVRHLILLLDSDFFEKGEEEPRNADFAISYRQDLNDGKLASQMRLLQDELDHPGPMSRLLVESLCCEIAVRTLRLSAVQAPKRAIGGLAPRRVRMVREYVAANLGQNITLAQLASVAGVSRSHFSRAFRISVGVGAHRYLISQRLEWAKKLLTAGKMPIAEVALTVGFGNQSHLTTHFRREVGTTPARFRSTV